MQHTIIHSPSMFIEDTNKRLWASVKPVTAGSSLYDVFVCPNAGAGHHMQLNIEEIRALTEMLIEITDRV